MSPLTVPSHPAPARTRSWPYVLFAVWVAGIVAGFCYVIDYEFEAETARPRRWALPEGSETLLHDDLPTLLLFAHPKCPCTRATIGELNRLMAICDGRLVARVLFVRPGDAPRDRGDTDLRSSAASIPGVTVQDDLDGEAAARFGATTSGQALLYAPDGTLLFSGGITAARGREGSNAGRSAIVSHVLSDGNGVESTPAFGCRLQDPAGK